MLIPQLCSCCELSSLNSFNFLFILTNCLFSSALFYFWVSLLIEVMSSWMSKSPEKFSSGFCGRWYLKVFFSLWVAQILSFPLLCTVFSHAPCYCSLFFEWSIQLASEFVNRECDMQSPRVIHSLFCVGFHNDLWFAAEVSTSYLFFLFLSPLNQWNTWETGIPSMCCC